MIRRIESEDDLRRGVATYELPDGRCACFDVQSLRLYGLKAMLEDAGVELPTQECQPLFWHGRQVGTVPDDFDPLLIKSSSWLYDPRPGDFRRAEEGWVAANTLGPGDLEAVPGFVWGANENTR